MARLRQFSAQTEEEIRRVLERERQSKDFSGGPILPEEDDYSNPRERWVRTTTNGTHPTYPQTPATKFVAEFGEYKFDEKTVGNETAVFTAYNPQQTRVMYSHVGWIPQGTISRASLHHGRWFLKLDYKRVRLKAKTTSTIADGGSGLVTIWLNGAVTSPVWQVTAWLNWMNGTSTIGSGKEVLIEWFQDESNGAGKWIITEREC